MKDLRILRVTIVLVALSSVLRTSARADERPNIFLAISDDQSWPHASAYGSNMVNTPAFDQVAREGALFHQAFCASPGCSPSRAALLTGRNTWQLEHAGTHASYFAPKYQTFPERLESEGYFVGYTGKGWGPGDFSKLGRKRNPAGTQYGKGRKGGPKYVESFAEFLADVPDGKPFCFWFGSHDPHRVYEKGSGLKKGKSLAQAEVPKFLPEHDVVRSDLLDYSVEVEQFDDHVGRMLAMIEKRGDEDNTLVIVTSDNGMPFPRAKANCYEYGIHMPLAVRWPKSRVKNRKVNDLVGFTDLTATIYDVTGVAPPTDHTISGKSIRNLLEADGSGILDESRTAVYSARERHSSSRYQSLGYPQRAIRTHAFLLIRNFRPERWPAGPGKKYDRAKFDDDGNLVNGKVGKEGAGYHDIDGGPSLSLLTQAPSQEIRRFLDLAAAHRPAIELFDIQKDPGCLVNLADNPEFAAKREELASRLNEYLTETGDARVTDHGDVWESYPRVSSLRWFPKPTWAEEKPAVEQEWLESRRPK